MHIAYVTLLWGPKLSFSYLIPHNLFSKITVGSFVKIPLGNSIRIGIVLEIKNNFKELVNLKNIIEIYSIPISYISFIEYLSGYYQLEKHILYKSLNSWLKKASIKEKLITELNNKEVFNKNYVFNYEQKEVLDFIQMNQGTFLLHGVTGSGKTNIYTEVIRRALVDEKKSSILLAPEIVLAYALYEKIKSLLPEEVPIFLCTSKTTDTDKKKIIECVLHGIPIICVGVHIPLFLPFQSIGYVIVDEEHDGSYVMPNAPFLNTKHIALIRAKYDKSKIILGSATPSVQSLYNAEIKKYHYLKLTKRYFGTLIEKPNVVHLTAKNHIKDSPWISNILYEAIQETLNQKKQIIIYINRRGMYNYAQCSSCKIIYWCPQCSIPFTVHYHDVLECHKCNTKSLLQINCVSCNKKTVVKKGVGTQQIVQLLSDLFPNKNIERLDYEIAISKKSTEYILENMHNQTIDILVGTQLLSKGLHFKHVDLVGIICADACLGLPSYKNYEEVIQKVIQISGRTGRENRGQVILQTSKQHIDENFFYEHCYYQFYKTELEIRKQYGYPPFMHLSELTIFDKNEAQALKFAENLYKTLEFYNKNKLVDIVTPIKGFPYKLKNTYYWNIILRSQSSKDIFEIIKSIQIYKLKYVYFVPTL